jgi:2,3-bisphosphoglycerate-dependent phosphoglycerate mutase
MYKIVLVRHGQSQWNEENRFTGWTDVDLTERGSNEARRAGRALKLAGYEFDIALTSYLRRAVRTLWLMQEELDRMWIPVDTDWRINERHYGALQGLNKKETVAKHGEDQVKLWRRGYDVRPPALEEADPRHPGRDPRYRNLAQPPATESLADTRVRVLAHWNEKVIPLLRAGRRVLVSSHGNSMRALAMHLEQLTGETVMALNIPTGIPLVYELDGEFRMTNRFYLADEATVRAAEHEVAAQTAAR